MYFLFGIFLILCIFFVCLQLFRRKRVICKVKEMDDCEKICILNELLAPFGFCYHERQDIITSTCDAWQRKFGYCSLYDRTAVRFGMVFDCEPVYFYYRRRTYRIELWKGQYGVNIGAEIGIYYAEGILSPSEFDKAHFRSVSDEDMLMMEMALYYKGQKMFENSKRHWWLTGFCAGCFCQPEDLVLRLSITCEDQKMLSCFVKSLVHMGYQECDIVVCDLTVCFTFCFTHCRQPRCRCCKRAAWVQWKNRIFVKLFVCVTKPFHCLLDRVMYLYLFLPSSCRRMCRHLCRRNRRQKCRRRHCGRRKGRNRAEY